MRTALAALRLLPEHDSEDTASLHDDFVLAITASDAHILPIELRVWFRVLEQPDEMLRCIAQVDLDDDADDYEACLSQLLDTFPSTDRVTAVAARIRKGLSRLTNYPTTLKQTRAALKEQQDGMPKATQTGNATNALTLRLGEQRIFRDLKQRFV
mmetsp:Transcript_15952/g.34619  ORF Transcript_15952/g.34619 Transcript_15952/m.34619 type:complete len:155 (-) Transcript_15952:65-529(-)